MTPTQEAEEWKHIARDANEALKQSMKEIEDLKAQHEASLKHIGVMYHAEIEGLKAQVKAKDDEIISMRDNYNLAYASAKRRGEELSELRGKVERLTELLKETKGYLVNDGY